MMNDLSDWVGVGGENMAREGWEGGGVTWKTTAD